MKSKKKPTFHREEEETPIKKKKAPPKQKYKHFKAWLEDDQDPGPDTDLSFDYRKWAEE